MSVGNTEPPEFPPTCPLPLSSSLTTSEVNDYVESLSRGCSSSVLEGNRFSSKKVIVKIICPSIKNLAIK